MMKEERVLQFKICGKDVTPFTTPLSDLVDILSSLDKSIFECAKCLGDTNSEEESLMSLVKIEEGSNSLFIAFFGAAMMALSRISDGVYTKSFDILPPDSYKSLFELSQKITKKDWIFHFPENRKFNIKGGVISKENPVSSPLTSKIISGTTTIYGRLLRIGGAVKPRAELRQFDGPILMIDVDESNARILAKYLYDDVGLEGIAQCDSSDYSIKEFKVTRILDFIQTDPITAFERLAKAAQGHFDNIDAEKYVDAIRHGE